MNITGPERSFSNTSTPDEQSRGMVLVVSESCLLIVLNCVALFGNLLMCVVLKRNPSPPIITNIFILSLAFTDLLMAVFVMPLITASSVANRWVAVDFILKTCFSCALVLYGTSVLTVMLIAINRYVKMTRTGTDYRKIFTRRNSKLMAGAAWISTTLLTGVAFSFLGVHLRIYRLNPASPEVVIFTNKVGRIYFIVIFSTYVIVPGLTVLFCYLKIFKIIRHHNRAGVPSTLQTRSSYGVAEKRIGKNLAAVVGFYYLCWLPGLIAILLKVFNVQCLTYPKYHNFLHTFPNFASSMGNPVIYGVMNPSFRLEVLKLFRDRR